MTASSASQKEMTRASWCLHPALLQSSVVWLGPLLECIHNPESPFISHGPPCHSIPNFGTAPSSSVFCAAQVKPFCSTIHSCPYCVCSLFVTGAWSMASCQAMFHKGSPQYKASYQREKMDLHPGLTRGVGGWPPYITVIPAELQVFYTNKPNSVVCIALNVDLLKSQS